MTQCDVTIGRLNKHYGKCENTAIGTYRAKRTPNGGGAVANMCAYCVVSWSQLGLIEPVK